MIRLVLIRLTKRSQLEIPIIKDGTDLTETLHTYGKQIQIAGEQTEDLIRSGLTEAKMNRQTRDTLLPAAGVRTGVRPRLIGRQKES